MDDRQKGLKIEETWKLRAKEQLEDKAQQVAEHTPPCIVLLHAKLIQLREIQRETEKEWNNWETETK